MRVLRIKAREERGGGRGEQEEPRGSEEGEGAGAPGCQPNLLKIDSCCGFIESYMRGR